ncbi:hypothetical protein BMS3Abin12_01697 [bacterium BMS3Abin12]|nr:hypothetical protein BMS3Abin12_01697 [bacterium BMS3Abin12]
MCAAGIEVAAASGAGVVCPTSHAWAAHPCVQVRESPPPAQWGIGYDSSQRGPI